MKIMAMKKYTDNYELTVTENEKGYEKHVAVYRGDYFEISLDQVGLVNFKKYCIFLLVPIVVLHISGGYVNNQGMYQFYVAFPYVFAFLPLIYMAAGVFRLPKEKRKYRQEEIGFSFTRIKISSKILITLLGFTVVGETAFLLFASVGISSGLDYMYIALEILAGIAVYFIINLQKQILVQTSTEQEEK